MDKTFVKKELSPHSILVQPHIDKILNEWRISEKIMKERGYNSYLSKDELPKICKYDESMPLIGIISYSITPSLNGIALRLNTPKVRNGFVYEYFMCLAQDVFYDVHPAHTESVRNSNEPLLITLDICLSDCALTCGVIALTLFIDESWHGLDDLWNKIQLNERKIYILTSHSNDHHVLYYDKLKLLSDSLKTHRADVRFVKLSGNENIPINTFPSALSETLKKSGLNGLTPTVIDDQSPLVGTLERNGYGRSEQGLYKIETNRKGETFNVNITNFPARIVRDLVETEGDNKRQFVLEALVNGKQTRGIVAADNFSPLNWIYSELGSQAIIAPGSHTRDTVRAAIQSVSDNVSTVGIHRHTGWIIQNGQHLFLHGNGAIGAGISVIWPGSQVDMARPILFKNYTLDQDGPAGPAGPAPAKEIDYSTILVDLPAKLAGYELPPPTCLDTLKTAVRESLQLLDFTNHEVSYPLLAAMVRAPLGNSRCAISLNGLTGLGKSTLVTAYLSHFGSSFTHENLPGNWNSTFIYNEALAHAAKDVPLPLDDFVNRGTKADFDKANKSADQLFRNHSNGTARGRARGDGTMRESTPSRCLPVSTQEVSILGHSLSSRVLQIDIAKADILAASNLDKLNNAQKLAKQGVYALAMSGYIAFLARDLEKEQVDHRERHLSSIDCFSDPKGHARLANVAADLVTALDNYTFYATEIGAIDDDHQKNIWEESHKVFKRLVTKQQISLAQQNPVIQFINCLREAFMSGRCHHTSLMGTTPDAYPERYGWRETSTKVTKYLVPTTIPGPFSLPGHKNEPAEKITEPTEVPAKIKYPRKDVLADDYGLDSDDDVGVKVSEGIQWNPQGSRIGFVDYDMAYLLPDAALAAAQKIATAAGYRIALDTQALGKMLHREGLINDSEADRKSDRFTRRVNAISSRPRVYWIYVAKLIPKEWSSCRYTDVGHELDDDMSEIIQG